MDRGNDSNTIQMGDLKDEEISLLPEEVDRLNESNSQMRDLKDEEIGLLPEKTEAHQLSNPVSYDGLPTSEEVAPSQGTSKKVTTWSVAIALLIFMGLLAIISAIFYVEYHTQDSVFRARRDSLKAPLNVLVVGDWGREGQYNQTGVAHQMGNVGKDLDVNFTISTGDNFYETGLDNISDPLFEKSFSKIYQAPSLQKTWYAVLGNHDYRGNPEVQVDRSLKSRDSRWFCDYTYTLAVDLGHADDGRPDSSSSSVEFFFIDTNPFVEEYWTGHNEFYNWTRPIPRNVVVANQLKNLAEALEISTATWKLVVGHHTMFSYGGHGDSPELIDKVLPILKANSVDLYINGHEHTLQDIKHDDSDIHFVTSGGGSQAWTGHPPRSNVPDSDLFYDGQGFISISISPTFLHVDYYDISGTIIHQIVLKK